MDKIQEIPLFFIIGRPRSGTTLLRLLFEAHPNVIIPPECPVILDLYKKYRNITHWKQEDLDAFYRDFSAHRYFKLWLTSGEQIRQNLMSCKGEHSFETIIKTFYLSYRSLYPKEDIRMIGDKNPGYALFIKKLSNLFPASKFIYINRDYRDNYLSLIRVNFEVPVIPLVVYRWKFVCREFFRLREKEPARFCYIKYEDLVTRPEEEMTRLCRFLDIPFDPKVFEFYREKDKIKSEYVGADELMKTVHQSLLNPVHAGKVDVWKNQMKETEIRKADLVAGKTAEKAGYVRKYTRINLLLYLRMLPVLVYGKWMYAMILSGEKLPLILRKVLREFLGIFLKLYWSMNRKKQNQANSKNHTG